MDEVFKALADSSRRKLLDEFFKSNGQTLGELCEHLDMTRQAVTKHLGILEAANLVATVWRGREKLALPQSRTVARDLRALTWADPDDLKDKSRVTFEIQAI